MQAAEVLLPPGAGRERLEALRQALSPAQEAEAAVRIRALEGFLDFDAENQVFYSPGRTRVEYEQYFLEADRLIYDTRLQEVQAEGNVILRINETTFHSDSLRYDFSENEGIAHNVSGAYGPLYFRMAREEGEDAQLQQVSEQQSIFRNTDITTCDFKVPHYYVRGREVILFREDRVFIRGATIYVMAMPVMYLPFYTRSLTAGSPWSFQVGYGSRTGARLRIGYRYSHRTIEPELLDAGDMRTRSAGHATVYTDLLSKIGVGAGFDYDYSFEYGRHEGELSLYGLKDKEREVAGNDPAVGELFDEEDRYAIIFRHRSAITEDLQLQANIDTFSDPDIFYDALDYFVAPDEERERQVTRGGKAALTWRQDAYVARIMADLQDRIGLDRYNDFADPRDDNSDYAIEPGVSLEDTEADGISRSRWGEVRRRLQARVATRWLPVGRQPLYYTTEIDIYRALDKGLNVVGTDDDGWVSGAEFYQALMYRWRLSQRTTLLTRAGVGVGGATRNDDDLGIEDFGPTFPQMIDGLEFEDHDTFLAGRDRRSLDDIRDAYLWGDAEARLHSRLTDALTGWLGWRFRETTDDFIGDFYASLGSQTFRDDLYPYRIREHWVEGNLTYTLARPLLSIYTQAGLNLLSGDELYSKEPLAYVSTGARWSNQRQTLILTGGAGARRQQIFDPSDPDEYTDDRLYLFGGVVYQPVHRRWWTSLEAQYAESLKGQTERDDDDRFVFFTDEDPRGELEWSYGRELGPKWETEIGVNWDQEVGGLREVAWLLQRDMHDAVATLEVTLDNKFDRDRRHDIKDRNDREANEIDVRLGLQLKMPIQGGEETLGPGQPRTIKQRYRPPALAH